MEDNSMQRLITIFVTLCALTLFMGYRAHAEEGHHTLGLQAGQVGLGSDVGARYGNALGYGAFFDYAGSDYLDFELGFLTSKHTSNSLSYTGNDFAVGAVYNFLGLDIFIPYIKGDAEFLSATEDILNPVVASSFSSTAFGLAIGGGGKFNFGTNFMAGLDLMYHNMFDTSVSLASGTSAKAIQPFYTVMLRIGYVFDQTSKKPGKTF